MFENNEFKSLEGHPKLSERTLALAAYLFALSPDDFESLNYEKIAEAFSTSWEAVRTSINALNNIYGTSLIGGLKIALHIEKEKPLKPSQVRNLRIYDISKKATHVKRTAALAGYILQVKPGVPGALCSATMQEALHTNKVNLWGSLHDLFDYYEVKSKIDLKFKLHEEAGVPLSRDIIGDLQLCTFPIHQAKAFTRACGLEEYIARVSVWNPRALFLAELCSGYGRRKEEIRHSLRLLFGAYKTSSVPDLVSKIRIKHGNPMCIEEYRLFVQSGVGECGKSLDHFDHHPQSMRPAVLGPEAGTVSLGDGPANS